MKLTATIPLYELHQGVYLATTHGICGEPVGRVRFYARTEVISSRFGG